MHDVVCSSNRNCRGWCLVLHTAARANQSKIALLGILRQARIITVYVRSPPMPSSLSPSLMFLRPAARIVSVRLVFERLDRSQQGTHHIIPGPPRRTSEEHGLGMADSDLILHSPSPDAIPVPIPGLPSLRASLFHAPKVFTSPPMCFPSMPCSRVPCGFHWQRVQNRFIVES